jgi:hypothetical protein
VLIGLPGVREIGAANDALNRQGVAVALRPPGVDERSVGDVIDYRAALKVRWTDESPQRT